jgi:hypothetical protein
MCFSRPGKAPLITPHPGYCGEELVAADPVTLSRERELSFLLFHAMLARNRVAGAAFRCKAKL